MAKIRKLINLSTEGLRNIRLIKVAGGFSSDNAAIEAALLAYAVDCSRLRYAEQVLLAEDSQLEETSTPVLAGVKEKAFLRE